MRHDRAPVPEVNVSPRARAPASVPIDGGFLRWSTAAPAVARSSLSHDLAEVLLDPQEGGSHPPFDHPTVAPTANPAGSHANSGMRAFNEVSRSQAAMKRGR